MAIKRDKILKTAEKLVQKGKLEQAIKEYEKLLAASPDDTNTINRLGDLYGRVGEIDKAVDRYEQVASQFADQGFLPKAIAIFKKINRLAPQRLDIFERLGELYVEQGLMVEAKSQFTMLAEHYAKNDDMESAVRAHQRLNDIDPNDSTSRLKFADMLLESGDTEQAMDAYGALGDTLIQHDQLDEAERLFRRLLDHELLDGEVMAPVCDRLLDAGRMTSAQELLTAGIAVSPNSSVLRTLQVRAFMALGETDRATDLAREILDVEPGNADVRGLVGNLLMSDGDDVEATEMMIPAAEALLEKADYSRAQKMLRELVEIAPTDERILRLSIRAFRPSGDQEMITRLTASLADVCFSSGQKDQAKRFYLELVASDPTNELYRERLAQLDGAMVETQDGVDTTGLGDGLPSEISFAIDVDDVIEVPDESEPASQSASSFDPTERINEAAVFAKYGLNDKAVKHLEDVVDRLPDNIEAREALAKMYLAVGERESAATTISPIIEELRSAGKLDAAAELESLYGTASTDVEDDDEIIIVEIDDEDEMTGAQAEGLLATDVDLGGVAVEDEVEIVEPPVDDSFLAAVDLGDVVVDLGGVSVEDEVEIVESPVDDSFLAAVDLGDVVVDLGGVSVEDEVEIVESPVDDSFSPAVDLSNVDVDNMVASAIGDLGLRSGRKTPAPEPMVADDLLGDELQRLVERTPKPAAKTEVVADEVAHEAPVVEEVIEDEPIEIEVIEEELIEDELVEEELVEISTGVEGPSFNELAQLDLFVDQELYEDAVGILGRLEEEYPGDHDLAARRQTLDDLGVRGEPVVATEVEIPAAVAPPTAFGEPVRPPAPVAVEPPQSSDDIFGDEPQDDYIDLAKELEDELAEEEAMVEEATGRGKGEALLDEVFKEFQKGVAEQLSDEDSDTHFNLGIAYKEMGLLEEAIAEFQIASHDPEYFVEACSMIGVCANEVGKHEEAAEWYQKALVAPDLSADARTALRYELAFSFEKTGEIVQAVGIFEDIQNNDPSYRDVGVRLAALTQQRQVN
jgi:tetratricopeptide (TPR) repeat protein